MDKKEEIQLNITVAHLMGECHLYFKSFLTSEEQNDKAFIEARHNEFFMSLNYGL